MKTMKRLAIIALIFTLPLGYLAAQSGTKKATKKKTAAKPKPAPKKAAKEINWFKGNEDAFEDSVAKWKKPGIVYVYIDNGEACPAFYEKVLLDTDVINYVDSNFAACRVNLAYDSPHAMKFNIDDVPSIVLLDRKGHEMDVLTGYQDKKALRKFLKQGLKK